MSTCTRNTSGVFLLEPDKACGCTGINGTVTWLITVSVTCVFTLLWQSHYDASRVSVTLTAGVWMCDFNVCIFKRGEMFTSQFLTSGAQGLLRLLGEHQCDPVCHKKSFQEVAACVTRCHMSDKCCQRENKSSSWFEQSQKTMILMVVLLVELDSVAA